jgi:hypothetical protein
MVCLPSPARRGRGVMTGRLTLQDGSGFLAHDTPLFTVGMVTLSPSFRPIRHFTADVRAYPARPALRVQPVCLGAAYPAQHGGVLMLHAAFVARHRPGERMAYPGKLPYRTARGRAAPAGRLTQRPR